MQNSTKTDMTYEQRYAALELMDKLYEFAEQYKIPEQWTVGIRQSAKLAAEAATGINIDEA